MNLLTRLYRDASSYLKGQLAQRTTFIRGGPTASGVAVDPRSALAFSAVFACINVIAGDTASLPLRVYRRREGGGRDEVRDHPASELLAVSPDGETTAMRWRQAWMGHCLGWGNGYAEIEFDRGGRPIGLHLLDPGATRAERKPQDGRLFYRHGAHTLPPSRVLHLAGLGFDGLSGYSPILTCPEAAGLGLATQAFGGSFFGKGARPGLVLKHPTKFRTEEARKKFGADWQAAHGGPGGQNGTAILEDGMDVAKISVDPETAQFLQTRQFQVLEIARLYRVPPHKIGDFSQSHLANIEAANLDYATTTLAPWCEQQEQVFNLRLLTREERAAGFYIEHVMTALLRGDMKARAEFYTKLRDLGVLTPNLICEFENMNPIGPEGDIRLVPLNMVNLKQAGMPKPQGARNDAKSK